MVSSASGKREVVLSEDFALREAREPVRLHFVTPLRAQGGTPGRVLLSGGSGPAHVLLYDPKRFVASLEERAVDDSRLRPVWGETLTRIVLTGRVASTRGAHRIAVRAAGVQP